MGNSLEKVPEEMHEHIRLITRTLKPPQTEDAVDYVARGWLEKMARFETIIGQMALDEVERLARTDPRGCLAVTVSGSIVNIGPLRRKSRLAQYRSIGLRTDVPRQATNIRSTLAADITVGAPVRFTAGPIARSSPVVRIAVLAVEVDLEDLEHAVRGHAARPLTREFIEAYRELEVGEG